MLSIIRRSLSQPKSDGVNKENEVSITKESIENAKVKSLLKQPYISRDVLKQTLESLHETIDIDKDKRLYLHTILYRKDVVMMLREKPNNTNLKQRIAETVSSDSEMQMKKVQQLINEHRKNQIQINSIVEDEINGQKRNIEDRINKRRSGSAQKTPPPPRPPKKLDSKNTQR